ncbi:hypothetical protein KR222_009465, partial [Zaprionus bogoriensis]
WQQFIAHTPDQPDTFYQYNRLLSDMLPAVRTLPQTRHDSCNSATYSLPPFSVGKVSVVISFYDEARSVLLRTILTLISRTPEDYLHELIIIDDCSKDAELLESLHELISVTWRRLSLVFRRNTHRKGLIWSRNAAARLASGHYLLFLDSHCEVNDGWLEPLLDRLVQNACLAVSPLLDPIDPETLSYRHGNVLLRGGFDWSLHFHWLPRVLDAEEPPERAYTSPAFSGGIMMISREWFFKLHGFNPHLQIWGGESIEFAIKLWLCGGQIEIVPCSRIGHIFRPRHAFEFPPQFDQQLDTAQATYLRNSKIIAESWLDEYKYLFYSLRPAAKRIPLNLAQQQLELDLIKTGQRCHRFDWYMRHVNSELNVQHANFSALGILRNGDRCLQVRTSSTEPRLLLASCYQLDVAHWHLHRETGQLSTANGLCMAVELQTSGPTPARLSLEPCLSGEATLQRWRRRDTQLVHAHTHLCLDSPLQDQLDLSRCRPLAASQSFQFALEMETQR